jgi:dipeptidyl aminopeptidase/acylaminoacyl peptidase
MEKVMSGMFVVNDENLQQRSAIYWAEKFCNTTPLLMIHGTADWRVSVLDTLELAQKLYEHKKPFRTIIYEGAEHGISEFAREKDTEIVKWFDRFLKNKEPLPNLDPHGM